MAKARKKKNASHPTRSAAARLGTLKSEVSPADLDRLQHFSPGYNLTDAEVERALESGDHRSELEPYFGEAAYEELHSLAQKARRQRRGGPRLLVLPGIMGSKLGFPRTDFFDDVIWIDPIDIARGNMSDLVLPTSGKPVKALGVILFVYLKLKFRLALQGFDVDFHPFDWRLSIDESGRELKARIDQECGTGANRRDISLVAHSMGGPCFPQRNSQMGDNHDHIRRLIMLGTPNNGSFAPVLVSPDCTTCCARRPPSIRSMISHSGGNEMWRTAQKLTAHLFVAGGSNFADCDSADLVLVCVLDAAGKKAFDQVRNRASDIRAGASSE